MIRTAAHMKGQVGHLDSSAEHQEVWARPSWSSTALRYDAAFI
jgi:hypothetical protein